MTSKYIVQNTICIIASVILFVMSMLSILGNREPYETGTGLFCALFCLVPIFLRKAHLITVPTALTVMAEIAIFFHAYGVLLLKYDDVIMWDTLTHTLSSIVVALCVFYALMCIEKMDTQMKTTPLMMHVYILLITLTFSVIWEVFELFADNLLSFHMQYSPWDTVRDFICDGTGAIVIVIYSHFYLKKRNATVFIDELELSPKLTNYVSHHNTSEKNK